MSSVFVSKFQAYCALCSRAWHLVFMFQSRVPFFVVLVSFGALFVIFLLISQHTQLSDHGSHDRMEVEMSALREKVQSLEWLVWQVKAQVPSGRSARSDSTAIEVSTLKSRVQDLEVQVARLSLAERKRDLSMTQLSQSHACTHDGLSDLSSKAAMWSAGWKINADEESFASDPNSGMGLIIWRSQDDIGSLAVRFRVSGKVELRVGNPHTADGSANLVKVHLNDYLLLELSRHQEEDLCFYVLAGDHLRLSEAYGQIHLLRFKFTCEEHRLSEVYWPPAGNTTAAHCSPGQRIFTPDAGHMCSGKSSLEWHSGVLQRALNETHALAEIKGDAHSPGQDLILPAQKLFTAPEASASRCANLGFKRIRIGIVVVADEKFKIRYSLQIRTMRCYAYARGYEIHLLSPGSFETCSPISDIYYAKPCLVSAFLAEKPAEYVVAFLDADVVPFVLDRGLEEWLQTDSDLHFYERDWIPEVMSGIFLARNKPWVRTWLRTWSEFLFRRPPGFSSADNGALHQHFVETMGLPGAEACGKLYSGLVTGQENRTPYWSFVECTNTLMGPPATFKACAKNGSSDCGLLTIWPRLNFAAVDFVTLSSVASKFVGPVMLHGMKSREEVNRIYRNIQTCEVNPDVLESKDVYGKRALRFSHCCPDLFPQLSRNCSQCVDRCMSSLTCRPLPLGADPTEVIAAKTKVDVVQYAEGRFATAPPW